MPCQSLRSFRIARAGRPESPLTATSDDRTPNSIDLHVGARVRMRRKMLGLSQELLAGSLSLTFQQVQKYEKGANRVSASKLYEIAKTLKVPVAYFFEGLPDPSAETTDVAAAEADRILAVFLATSEGLELASAFPRIDKPRLRRQILELTRSMATEEAATAAS